jgi:hypothetical protein
MPTVIAASNPVPNEAIETETTNSSEMEYPQISDASEIKKDLSIMKRDKRFAPLILSPLIPELVLGATIMVGALIGVGAADSTGSSRPLILTNNPSNVDRMFGPNPIKGQYWSPWSPSSTTESTKPPSQMIDEDETSPSSTTESFSIDVEDEFQSPSSTTESSSMNIEDYEDTVWSPSSTTVSSSMNNEDLSLYVQKVQQLTMYNCGPAIGESILRHFRAFDEDSPTLQSILSNGMSTIQTDGGGTSPINWMNGMNNAIRQIGIHLEMEYSITEFTGEITSRANDITRFNNIVRTSLQHNVPVAFAFSGSETFVDPHLNHFIVIDGFLTVPIIGSVYQFMDPLTGTRGTMDHTNIFRSRISDSTQQSTSNRSRSYLIAYIPQTPSSTTSTSNTTPSSMDMENK